MIWVKAGNRRSEVSPIFNIQLYAKNDDDGFKLFEVLRRQIFSISCSGKFENLFSTWIILTYLPTYLMLCRYCNPLWFSIHERAFEAFLILPRQSYLFMYFDFSKQYICSLMSYPASLAFIVGFFQTNSTETMKSPAGFKLRSSK